jgi:hypothetical protein
MPYTIRDNEINVSPNGTLTMTLAKTQAAAQVIVVSNILEETNALEEILALEIEEILALEMEEILTLEMQYATGAMRRAILNEIAKLNFGSLPMALPSVAIMAESIVFNNKGSNSLLLLNQTLNQIHLSLLCSSNPGMGLRQIMSGYLNLNYLYHRDLIPPLLCSSCPGMDLLRQIMSGCLNHNHLYPRDLVTRDLMTMHTSYRLTPCILVIRNN